MNTIRVSASRAYDILLENGLFDRAGAFIRARFRGGKAMLVTDDTVFSLYGESLLHDLENAGMAVCRHVFHHGERSKNLITYADILETFCSEDLTRGDVVIALGGGVVGDLAGFSAATYQRGLTLVQIPTTLLACVDSSVGGKTAVNLSGGKNLAGCFYQPSLVLIDPTLLSTLSEQEFRSGFAEVIKYAVIGDRELFDDLLRLEDRMITEDVIGACVRMKRRFVERDEFDTGERMLLNFGHTLGHAVERCSNFTVPHGFGVAMGMAALTRAAAKRGLCEKGAVEELEHILKKNGLPAEIPFSASELAEHMMLDKKRRGRLMHIVIPEKIGRCVILETSVEDIPAWLADGGIE